MPAVPYPSSPARRTSRVGAAVAVALTMGALTSCSGGADTPAAGTSAAEQAPSSSAGPDSPSSSTLQATEADFSIDLSDSELEAGTYTVEVANEGGATHDLVVEDADGNDVAATEAIPPGGSGTVEVTLEPGEYAFYCSVGNHRGMGMEVTVTVV